MKIEHLQGLPFTVADIGKIQEPLNNFLNELNKATMIWGPVPSPMDLYATGTFGAALNHHSFSSEIAISDIDIMVPIGSSDKIQRYFNDKEIPNKKFGTQVHAIVELDGVPRQIDFTMKPMYARPSSFAGLTTELHELDINIGLRAVYHKLLLGSLTAIHSDKDALSIAYGLRRRDDIKPYTYETELDKITIRLFLQDDSESNSYLLDDAIYIHDQLYHFKGICELLKRYCNKEQILRVRDKFQKRLEDYRKAPKYSAAQETLCMDIFNKTVGL